MTGLCLEPIDASDALLKSELQSVSLPVDDLEENGCSFFAVDNVLFLCTGNSARLFFGDYS